MRIALLTTETPHHCFFVRQLNKVYPFDLIINETGGKCPSFEVSVDFEKERDVYEKDVFLGGEPARLDNYCETVDAESINDEHVAAILDERGIELLVMFGCSLVRKPLLSLYHHRIINLHGGDPELYRGLDSHLWAIYHGDYSALITTVHLIDERFDTGAVILKSDIGIKEEMRLHQLRGENTVACVKLTTSALDMYKRFGLFISCRQARKGRYYSAMPAPLKNICVEKFASYTASLRNEYDQ